MDSWRYRPGDRVMVRDDLDIGEYYNDIGVTKGMLEFRGKEVTISVRLERDSKNKHCYHIDEENGWLWTDDMFCEISYEDIDDAEDFRLLYEEFIDGRLRVQ